MRRLKKSMADEIDEIIGVSSSTAIQLYRAKIATPETFEDLRFFIQQELKRIEGGFLSVDEVLKAVAAAGGLGGGEAGADGQDGQDGAAGRGVHVYKQSGDPKAQGAQPGDVWFVQGYS